MNTAKETSRKWRILALFVAACMVLSVCSVPTTYAATKAPSVTIKSAKSAKAGELKVTWKKSKKAAGYQVVVAKDKKFKKGKKVKTVKKKTTSVTFKKLSKGTKYYAKVRGYKVVKGKKVYGKYSKIKSAKTKGKKATPLYKKVQNKTYFSKIKVNKEVICVKFGKASGGKIKLSIADCFYGSDAGSHTKMVTGTVKGNTIKFKVSKWYSFDGLYTTAGTDTISGTITLVNSTSIKIKTTSRDITNGGYKLLNPGKTISLNYMSKNNPKYFNGFWEPSK